MWKEQHNTIKPVMVGLENLRSLKWACWSERLSDEVVEDTFWNNAARLFNLPSQQQKPSRAKIPQSENRV